MSVFFAMIGPAEDRRPAFFLTRKSAPDDAVEITAARHAELLDAQADGRAIDADARGRPVLVRRQRPAAEELRARLRAAIKRDAARRIDQIAPIWRQLNDARTPSAEGERRFAQVDAIRDASDAIEALLADVADRDLGAFPISDNPAWPEFD